MKKWRKKTSAERRLIGIWETDPTDRETLQREGRSRIEFRSDGSMVYSIDAGDKWQQMFLEFKTEGDLIVTNQPSAPRVDRTSYEFTDDGKLVLDHGGIRSRYIRSM